MRPVERHRASIHDRAWPARNFRLWFSFLLLLMFGFGASMQVHAKERLPAWLADADLFEWVEIPDTQIDQADAWKNYKGARGNTGKRGLLAYSGAAVKTRGSEFFIAGGGHLDYAGNEIFSIRLGDDLPQWIRHNDPSTDTPMNTPYYPDGRPSSRHTYWNLVYDSKLDRLLFFGGAPWGDKPTYNNLVDSYNFSINDYDLPGTIASAPSLIGGPSGTGIDNNGNFYIHSHRNGHLYYWQEKTNSWNDLGRKGGARNGIPYALDTKRHRLFRIPGSNSGARYYDLNRNGLITNVQITGPAAEQISSGSSMVYDPVTDIFWLWKRNEDTLYQINASTFIAMMRHTTGIKPTTSKEQVYGRFNYLPELKGLILMVNSRTPLMFIRTAE